MRFILSMKDRRQDDAMYEVLQIGRHTLPYGCIEAPVIPALSSSRSVGDIASRYSRSETIHDHRQSVDSTTRLATTSTEFSLHSTTAGALEFL